MTRTQQSFDTSDIGEGAIITAAELSLPYSGVWDQLSPAGSICLVAFDNAYSPNQVGGYSKFGTTLLSDAVPLSGLSSSGTIVFTLNEDGIAHINKTGTTQFGFRVSSDVDNSAPTWETDKYQALGIYSATLKVTVGREAFLLGLPYQGMPPSLVEVGHVDDAVPDSWPDMDYVGEKIFIVYTGEDENTYGYISDEDGNGLGDPAMLIKEGAYVLCCGINRNTPDTLYAVVIDAAEWETIYLCTSTDNGETWDTVEICKGWNTSKMTCEGDYFYFLVERVDDEYNQTTEIYSNRWNGFSRIPQLDGEASLTYNRAVAASNV